jgi:hypothetical protein
MNDEPDNFSNRVAEVQSQLEARVGKENTQAIVTAISAQGFSQDFLRNVIVGDDAAANFVTLGGQLAPEHHAGRQSFRRRGAQGRRDILGVAGQRARGLAHSALKW